LKNKENITHKVRVVSRMVKILKSFSQQKYKLSLDQLSKIVDLPKSTTHRLITALKKENMIEQEQGRGRYYLSYEFVRLGEVAYKGNNLYQVALPKMQYISNIAEQTSNLYVVKGNKRLCIGQVPGPKYIRRYSYMGALFPLYCGSAGKVLLAFFDEEKLEEYFSSIKYDKDYQAMKIDENKLRKSLKAIRNSGYATTNQERVNGAASISAPIYGYHGKVLACITISGPAAMFNKAFKKKSIPYLLRAAQDISSYFGYTKNTELPC